MSKITKSFLPIAVVVALSVATAAQAATNGLAHSPYMGWSSWSKLRLNITEAKIKAQADSLALNLKSAGYVYINVDDGWYNGFDANGRWQADATKFPSGIASLAAYIHSKGLKFGIYMLPGLNRTVYTANSPIAGTSYHAQDIISNTSIQGNTKIGNAYKIDYSLPGAIEYVQGYADLLASWGVDAIKMDFVGPGGGSTSADNRDDIAQWITALQNTGRPIYLELSNGLSFGNLNSWATTSNGWRIEGDIEDYGSNNLTKWTNVARRFSDAPQWAPWAGVGAWNDLDSLELGNGNSDGITVDERQSAMTLWSISCAPLLIGSDLTALDATDLAMLTNSEVIAVDQQGRPATPVSQASNQQVWFAQNTDGSFTVALFNLDAVTATVVANWSNLQFSGSASVRDLWTHTDLGSFTSSFSASLATHACRLLKVTPTSNSQLITNGQYDIVNRNSGQTLDAASGGTAPGTNVDQMPYASTYNQRWTVTHLGNNQYKIVGVQSRLALEVFGNGTADGANVDIWTVNNGNNQKWTAVATSSGYVKLINVNSGKLLEVVGASTTNGANVDQWTDSNGNNQQWHFNGQN